MPVVELQGTSFVKRDLPSLRGLAYLSCLSVRFAERALWNRRAAMNNKSPCKIPVAAYPPNNRPHRKP